MIARGPDSGGSPLDGPGLAEGPACPVPSRTWDRVQLGHGSGGKMRTALLREHVLPRIGNAVLDDLGDAAVVPVAGGRIAVSTDTFVVDPLEFPGGDIGCLAVHGTLNDLAMMGASPRYLTLGMILEEGLPMDLLDRVLRSVAACAERAGVSVVTGDTKVVERGKGDGLYINTTGVGEMRDDFVPRPGAARPGDVIVVSGPLGRHGIAIMASREGFDFEVEIQSDTASLVPLVEALRENVGAAVRTLRDPTRGGLASALNEIAAASGVGMVLEDGRIPVPPPVLAACEMLGLDPLYVANEGVLVAIVAPEGATDLLRTLRGHPLGTDAAMVGGVVERHPGTVVLRTGLGGTRVVDTLPGDQLPRIC